MIKDVRLRLIFIPLLGITLPLISGIISYDRYTGFELVLFHLYFTFTSLLIWSGSHWMHNRIRNLYPPLANPFSKVATMCFAEGLYGASIAGFSAFFWFQFSAEIFTWNSFLKFMICCVLAVIVFTLIYEILFLSKERELDDKIVHQLDKERNEAALQALTRELDPHFIFNSLNTLNHLILNNPDQAYLFNNKLAQVYKYFLINRVRELIPLKDELEFIESYFFLLQIRHDNKLQLQTDISDSSQQIMIPPCALQILLENAIKHNEFNDTHPLRITIALNGHYLKVINNVKPKLYSVNSTGIGLKNLSSRYKIICKKDILIEKTRESYTVKLPLIK